MRECGRRVRGSWGAEEKKPARLKKTTTTTTGEEITATIFNNTHLPTQESRTAEGKVVATGNTHLSRARLSHTHSSPASARAHQNARMFIPAYRRCTCHAQPRVRRHKRTRTFLKPLRHLFIVLFFSPFSPSPSLLFTSPRVISLNGCFKRGRIQSTSLS